MKWEIIEYFDKKKNHQSDEVFVSEDDFGNDSSTEGVSSRTKRTQIIDTTKNIIERRYGVVDVFVPKIRKKEKRESIDEKSEMSSLVSNLHKIILYNK